MTQPTFEQIEEAAARISPHIHRTPVFTCRSLDAMSGAALFFKCENFQLVGAFKARGATNAVFSLSDREATCGVATHSSGNHAAALAFAARQRGICAYAVMPENAPIVKQRAVAGYGAEIVRCRPTQAAREATLGEVVVRTGATIIHPYDDLRVIAGQGTAALELCREVSDLDVVMAPVGGGGLLSGTALAVRGTSPRTCVLGAEPELADDALRSLQAGRIIPSTYPDTVADGLRTSLGELTFPIIREHVDAIATAGEAEIIAAMRTVWERMKLVIEPSAAVPLAAILSARVNVAGKRVGIILSGGNVDLDTLPWQRKLASPSRRSEKGKQTKEGRLPSSV
jgi:threonine dehydratase